jgi:hypothetical protein
MFCVMCQQVKSEAGALLPGRFERVCMSCFHRNAAALRGAIGSPGFPDPNAIAAEARQKAEALAAAQRQRLAEMQEAARLQAQAKLNGLAGQIPSQLQNQAASLQNNLAGRLNSISDGTSNTVRNAIVDGTSNRFGNAIQNLNKLKNRF